MPKPYMLILTDEVVRAAISQAWVESNPGISGGHEEGGFITRDTDGAFCVTRWPQGEQAQIKVPLHPDCFVNGLEIIASFHTHPNTGGNFLQEPSETDKRAVPDDPNLKGQNYVGEFVISSETIYLITPIGQVRELYDTASILADELE